MAVETPADGVLTTEQALGLAPDAASRTAARALAAPRAWQALGRSDRALWGACQGSALYHVRVDRANLAAKCSCPSRKFPCKHALGLMLLAAESPAALPLAAEPEWVTEWLAKRSAAATARQARAAEPGAAVAPAQQRRTDRRIARVQHGVDALERWLHDLIRNGLAGVELQPAGFWEAQAARLVDAQAPGLAGRARRLAAIPNASPDWPARLLAQLGKLALLLHAFRRLDALDAALQADVRQAIGWSVGQEDVLARGEVVADEWAVLSQRVEQEERLRVRRTWLRGGNTGRDALLLHFSAAGAPFEAAPRPGTRLTAALAFWPSAAPLRALPKGPPGAAQLLGGRLPGAEPIADHLERVAAQLARQPWLDLFPCCLRDVVPLRTTAGRWLLCDGADALPLAKGEHWQLLALSGGRPVDVAGEWDGEVLRPLALTADGAYHRLETEQ